MDFESNDFMGWNRSFDLEFSFESQSQDLFLTRVDIYYYNNPSGGYGLPDIRTGISTTGTEDSYTNVVSTFIDNSEVSQSDDNVQMLSLIILTPQNFLFLYQFFRLQFIFSSSFAATQTFISEMKFFTNTDTSFPAVPIVFMSPNQTLQPDTVQSSLTLSCTVDNNGTFAWTWTGPGVSDGDIKAADTTRTSILMLSNISAADAGDYTCSASYLAFGDSLDPSNIVFNSIKPDMNTTNNISLTLSSNVSAEVYYDGLLVRAGNTVTVQKDTHVTLSCTFTGYLPADYQINWMDSSNMADGTITNGDDTRNISQRGGFSTSPAVQSNYTILSVEVDDSGPYTCSMDGTELKETISLMVTSATVS
ncbi:PREDICTED: uncharacterized protein LOC109593037, partial [Amphimedon queenslandica]|uniref:Ig-like domain-containing protein n=2 Tax=Amphimedon queenslandica TaxID=400682 RepID=A0AAN0K2T4_AMPQE